MHSNNSYVRIKDITKENFNNFILEGSPKFSLIKRESKKHTLNVKLPQLELLKWSAIL